MMFDGENEILSWLEAKSARLAINEIEKNKGTQFDPKIANVFLQLLHTQNAAINQNQ